MRSPEQLESFRKQVDLYLDNALSLEESKQVINEAESNPEFGRLLKSESNFRNLLKNKVQRSTCSDSLINNIKNRIKL